MANLTTATLIILIKDQFVNLSHIKNFCLDECKEYLLVTFTAHTWEGELYNKEPFAEYGWQSSS